MTAREASDAVPAIVLAGERAGGNALARAHGLPASVLVPVAGQALIARVIASLRAARCVAGGLVVGPAAAVVAGNGVFAALLDGGDFRWLAPAQGPSASALDALAALDRAPALLTAGDHALLRPHVIDAFVAMARARDADFVIGLVPYTLVKAEFPHSRRTLLRFRDGTYCGANLFLLRTPAARGAPELWRALEHERKRPWRMAARLGPKVLCAYVTGRLDLGDALAALSARSGCRLDWVAIDDARAAVDVDSSADLALAEQVLRDG